MKNKICDSNKNIETNDSNKIKFSFIKPNENKITKKIENNDNDNNKIKYSFKKYSNIDKTVFNVNNNYNKIDNIKPKIFLTNLRDD